MLSRPLTALLLCLASITARAASSGLVGDWREPGGSVIHVAPCGPNLCLTLVALSPAAPSQVDIHNPNASQRQRPLCGLTIGHDFHPVSPTHADSGQLYDPKSGKTYHGEMTANGDTLSLRGYVGIKAFGRSESWTRTAKPAACPVGPHS